MSTIHLHQTTTATPAQIVAGLRLPKGVERDVVGREVVGGESLEVAEEAQRLALERHGAAQLT